jgi:hypothetical protein
MFVAFGIISLVKKKKSPIMCIRDLHSKPQHSINTEEFCSLWVGLQYPTVDGFDCLCNHSIGTILRRSENIVQHKSLLTHKWEKQIEFFQLHLVVAAVAVIEIGRGRSISRLTS